MQAKALICDESQSFTLADVALPDPTAHQVVVRALYSGISIGTEIRVIRNQIDWGPYPLCNGYQAVGIVEYVGHDVDEFKIGEKVYYRDNQPMTLSDGQVVSPTLGTHASHALIDPNNTACLALLPAGVDEDVASLFVMPGTGLQGVDMANVHVGDSVIVHGLGLIGLGVVAASRHRGAYVVAIDLDTQRLDIARKLGADQLIDASQQNTKEAVRELLDDGANVVFEATGVPTCVDLAADLCKPEEKLVLIGNYGRAPLSYHFIPIHGKRLTVFYPSDALLHHQIAVLRNMATGVLPWHHVLTHHLVPAEAPSFYDALNRGEAKGVVGAVIKWS